MKAMFFVKPGPARLAPAGRPIALPIVVGTIVVVVFGVMPDSLMSVMQAAAVPMLTTPAVVPAFAEPTAPPLQRAGTSGATPKRESVRFQYTPEQLKAMQGQFRDTASPGGTLAKPAGKSAPGKSKSKGAAGKSKKAAQALSPATKANENRP
jgi:hypothetical protein